MATLDVRDDDPGGVDDLIDDAMGNILTMARVIHALREDLARANAKLFAQREIVAYWKHQGGDVPFEELDKFE
jgi:hypothetical protein